MKPPIQVIHLFPVLDALLIDLLKSLTPAQWQLPTLAKQWTVKDIAAHLLDGNIRVIAGRDGHQGPPPEKPIESYADLVAFLNELNASWVNAMRRTSSATLTAMLETTGKQYSEIMAAQDLFAPAPFGVAWAGENESANWFHIAREYTEKWHHQQQIRQAVGQEAALMSSELFYPLIDTLLCGLPHSLRHTAATTGTTIQLVIPEQEGGKWYVTKKENGWVLSGDQLAAITTAVSIPSAIAWKLFTKGMRPADALPKLTIQGNETLGLAILEMVAVMA